jgi:hypothetical protein
MMDRDDFVKLAGVASDDAQYVPVAFLLCNGYACAGYYHPPVNKGLTSVCVLVNARLIELRGENRTGNQPSINDFNEFLEEIVASYCEPSGNDRPSPRSDAYGKSIPLTAVPFEQIAVVYPVAHIGSLMRRAEPQKTTGYRFLDLNQSEIIRLLQTKLW